MQTHPSLTADESKQETVLCAALHQYAPTEINTEQAWAIVSQLLSANEQSSLRSRLYTFLPWHPRKQGYRSSLKGRLIIATVACIAILVAGFNVLFPFLSGSNSVVNAQQYQQVGLSQSSNGLTMIVEKAYAGNKGTIIAYEVQPPADIVKLLKNAQSVIAGPSFTIENSHIDGKTKLQLQFTAKDQTEELKLPLLYTFGCATIKQYSWPIKCVLMLNAFQPPTSINKLNITLDITGMEILATQSSLVQKYLSGHWHFQFTVPFQHGKSLPSLPYQIDQLPPILPTK